MNQVIDILLLTSSQCPHCQTLKRQLDDAISQGMLSTYELINIEDSPEVANKYGVRSVPWLLLGSYEFDGAMKNSELYSWLTLLSNNKGNSEYAEYLLLNGKLSKLIDWLEKGNGSLQEVLSLIDNPDTKINVRIGVGAVMEHFEGRDNLKELTPSILEMLENDSPAIRADACHFLVLTRGQGVARQLQALLKDPDPHVREIAREGLDELN